MTMNTKHPISRMRRFLWAGCFILVSLPMAWNAHGDTDPKVEVPKEEIRQAVTRFLEEKHPWETAQVRVREVRIPGCIVLSTPQYDLEMRVPPNTPYLGHTPVEVIFNPGKPGEKKVWVSAYLEVLSPVVVTRRPMARHEIVSMEDVCLEDRDLAQVSAGAMTDVSEVGGQRLRRTVGIGTVLRSVMLENPPLVQRGDLVRLLIETETLKITALGRVDERGGRGDTVRVINLDSKRRVYGQVLDGQTVRVKY